MIWTQDTVIQALGWAIVHSCWLFVPPLLIGLGLRQLVGSARLRYGLLLGVLAGLPLLFAALLYQLWPEAASIPHAVTELLVVPAAEFSAPAVPLHWTEVLSRWIGPLTPYILALYWLGLGLGGLRLIFRYRRLQSLRVRGTILPPAEWLHRFRQLRIEAGVTERTQWLLSRRCGEVLTFGWWRPVILFPLGLLAGLAPAEAEAVLLHELAHIRRHDYLVNWVQSVLAALFFYHPAVHLLNRFIRREREFACDDWVTRRTDRQTYAASLLRTARFSITRKNQLAMHATKSSSGLTRRLHRLYGARETSVKLLPRLLLFLLLPLLLLGARQLWAADSETTAELVPEQSATLPTSATAAELLLDGATVSPEQLKEQYPGSLAKALETVGKNFNGVINFQTSLRDPQNPAAGRMVFQVCSFFLEVADPKSQVLRTEQGEPVVPVRDMVYQTMPLANGQIMRIPVTPDFSQLQLDTVPPDEIYQMHQPLIVLEPNPSKRPVYIINGERIERSVFNEIDPAKIKAINVYKDQQQIFKKFGITDAYYGLIDIDAKGWKKGKRKNHEEENSLPRVVVIGFTGDRTVEQIEPTYKILPDEAVMPVSPVEPVTPVSPATPVTRVMPVIPAAATTPVAPAVVELIHTLSPNPTGGTLTLEGKVDEPTTLRLAVYDLQGRLVRNLTRLRLEVGTYREKVDLGSLAAGNYILRAQSRGGEQNLPFIKK